MFFNKKTDAVKKEYFSQEWMDEWLANIKKSDEYKKKGKDWNSPVVIQFKPLPDRFSDENLLGIYLDLQYGECHDMRYANQEYVDKADVVLSADEKTWIRMIEERIDPIMMLMKGNLKVKKGSLVMLATHRQAAAALLQTCPAYTDAPSSKELKKSLKEPPAVRKEHSKFVSTGRGINFDSFPMQLFEKSKKFGIWNPSDIDLTKDKEHWASFTDEEKTIIIHLSSLFMAGEEAVTLDLLPLIQTISKEGRVEEEIYLTSFLWEEAKHTEFFARFVHEVIAGDPDFESFHKPFYKKLFYQKLPFYLNTLYTDTSPLAQLKASGTYNMIVEGTLAETGYEAYSKMLSEHNMLPGLLEGIKLLKQDESRHIAYGLYLINRILDEHPEHKFTFENHLEELLTDATNIINELFEPYDVVPFGLEKEWFLDYAIKQFQHRMAKIGL